MWFVRLSIYPRPALVVVGVLIFFPDAYSNTELYSLHMVSLKAGTSKQHGRRGTACYGVGAGQCAFRASGCTGCGGGDVDDFRYPLCNVGIWVLVLPSIPFLSLLPLLRTLQPHSCNSPPGHTRRRVGPHPSSCPKDRGCNKNLRLCPTMGVRRIWLQRLAEPKARAVFFPRVRNLKLFPGRIVFSTLLCDFASVGNKIMCIGIRRKIHVE